MGWVKNDIMTDDEILSEIKKSYPDKLSVAIGVRKSGSCSVYEFLTDLMRDEFGVSLSQCGRIALELKDYYGFKKFYATD
jgi:hypothetical protein